MKLRHKIAAGAALVFLVGCSQDQPVGGDKDASTASAYTNTNESREPAKAPALPPTSTPAPAQPSTDSQTIPQAPTNPPQAAPPASNPPGDHP